MTEEVFPTHSDMDERPDSAGNRGWTCLSCGQFVSRDAAGVAHHDCPNRLGAHPPPRDPLTLSAWGIPTGILLRIALAVERIAAGTDEEAEHLRRVAMMNPQREQQAVAATQAMHDYERILEIARDLHHEAIHHGGDFMGALMKDASQLLIDFTKAGDPALSAMWHALENDENQAKDSLYEIPDEDLQDVVAACLLLARWAGEVYEEYDVNVGERP